jgi:hypothetical protein
MNDSMYLAVHDELSFENGIRVSVIKTKEEANIEVIPVHVEGWDDEKKRSSDLEAICKIPDRDNEFLLVEAGHWEGEYGRMFHIKLESSKQSYKAKVLATIELPEFNAKGPNDRDGDEVEGVACMKLNTNELLLLLAERGGSSVYPSGVIRWVTLNLNTQKLTWTAAGKAGQKVNVSWQWKDSLKNRDISDLYLDKNQILWGAASEELSDIGPLNSVIYKIGAVTANSQNPFVNINDTLYAKPIRVIGGFKVEALAAPSTYLKNCLFTIGTEDEYYGGAWRPIK